MVFSDAKRLKYKRAGNGESYASKNKQTMSTPVVKQELDVA